MKTNQSKKRDPRDFYTFKIDRTLNMQMGKILELFNGVLKILSAMLTEKYNKLKEQPEDVPDDIKKDLDKASVFKNDFEKFISQLSFEDRMYILNIPYFSAINLYNIIEGIYGNPNIDIEDKISRVRKVVLFFYKSLSEDVNTILFINKIGLGQIKLDDIEVKKGDSEEDIEKTDADTGKEKNEDITDDNSAG